MNNYLQETPDKGAVRRAASKEKKEQIQGRGLVGACLEEKGCFTGFVSHWTAIEFIGQTNAKIGATT